MGFWLCLLDLPLVSPPNVHKFESFEVRCRCSETRSEFRNNVHLAALHSIAYM